MRRKVWLARGGRGIAGEEHQNKASQAALRRKTPEAQDLLFAEREGVLRRHLSEANDAGSVHSCDGRAKAVAAIGELAKSTENKTKSLASMGPISLRFEL
jgi:hypothetical protein